MNYNSIESLISGFTKVLKMGDVGGPTSLPSPVVYVGVPRRQGLSPIKIASKIISRKSEAGLPVGALPSGDSNPEEIMWRIAVEEIIKAFQEEAIITVGIAPGLTLSASGVSPSGPVTVFGSTISFGTAYGTIQ